MSFSSHRKQLALQTVQSQAVSLCTFSSLHILHGSHKYVKFIAIYFTVSDVTRNTILKMFYYGTISTIKL